MAEGVCEKTAHQMRECNNRLLIRCGYSITSILRANVPLASIRCWLTTLPFLAADFDEAEMARGCQGVLPVRVTNWVAGGP